MKIQIKGIQRLKTAILNIISTDEVKMAFNLLLDREKQKFQFNIINQS